MSEEKRCENCLYQHRFGCFKDAGKDYCEKWEPQHMTGLDMGQPGGDKSVEIIREGDRIVSIKEVDRESAKERKMLRDEFARSALIGILSCDTDHTGCQSIEKRVGLAYKYADLMLKERDKND